MWFNIDPKSSIPIYQQIIEQIKRSIAGGLLRPGDKLPSVRELAAHLLTNPNTIAKAYQELEREQIIETLRGRGTFVAETGNKIGEKERKVMLKKLLERFLLEAYQLQIPKDELQEIFMETIDEWYKGGVKGE